MSEIAKERGYGKWMLGRKPSEAIVGKIRAFHLGRKRSPETRKKISVAKTGKPRLDMTGNKFGCGWKPTDEQRKRMSESVRKRYENGFVNPFLGKSPWNKGMHWSDETKKLMSQNRFGKGRSLHPITPIVRRIRTSSAYNQWRAAIQKRDDYACQICQLRTVVGRRVRIHVDHYPESFASIIWRMGVKSYDDALSCSSLWDTNNGRVLCQECHRKTDSYAKKYVYATN